MKACNQPLQNLVQTQTTDSEVLYLENCQKNCHFVNILKH